MLKIIGLGPGAPEALTIGSLKELRNSNNIYFRTEKHPTVDFLKEEGIDFNTYDYAYENFDSFDDVYKYIANDLIKKVTKEEN
ncbi:MAG: nucleoside triphosphate pyrophosphohydrolase, partial [Sarcina sp.]